MSNNDAYIINNLTKEYKLGETSFLALNNISLKVRDGELLVILGPSGSGKSTLLNIIGGMDTPSSGHIFFQDKDISSYSKDELTLYRRYVIGFIFQFYNLIPNLTAGENIEISKEISKSDITIDEVFDMVGLNGKKDSFPAQLSGGEQQRVAIARAIVKSPKVLLCDEPTGALDYETGKKILEVLVDINKELKKTVIIITHNISIGKLANRVVKMRSGIIVDVMENENIINPREIEW